MDVISGLKFNKRTKICAKRLTKRPFTSYQTEHSKKGNSKGDFATAAIFSILNQNHCY